MVAGAFFVPTRQGSALEGQNVSDGDAGGAGKTYTQEELDAAIAEANKGLEENRDKVLGELKEVRTKLKAFDGVDPEEHRALQDRLAELEQQSKADKAGLSSEELKKLRADVQADVLKRLASDPDSALDALPWAKTLAAENRELKLDSVVKAQMAKGGARAERIDALFKLTADRFGLTDDGQPMLKDNPGLEVGQYVADELKNEYPEFYNGSGSSGGGASKSSASGGGPVTKIAADDGGAFLQNLEGIADGKVVVEM